MYNEDVERLGDWRIPAIFAVPILVWAGLLYLVFQPISGKTAAAQGAGDTITMITPSRPTFVPTPYPTVVPVAPVTAYVLPCSTGVTRMTATASKQGDNLVVKVADQRGRPVVCAWLVPSYVAGPNGYGLGGETDGNGSVTYSLASLPAHFHSVSSVQFDSAATAFDFSR